MQLLLEQHILGFLEIGSIKGKINATYFNSSYFYIPSLWFIWLFKIDVLEGNIFEMDLIVILVYQNRLECMLLSLSTSKTLNQTKVDIREGYI